ncbi:MAG: ATP-binding protein [Acidobacteriota bacterium]|nr:ATP-binding protein [Acidobacteriota bacterium]
MKVRVDDAAAQRRLWRLVLCRLVVALLVLAASQIKASRWLDLPGLVTLHSPLSAAVTAIILSVIYAIVLRFSALPIRAQAAIQFIFDVLLVTWLVWTTGDIYSPYAALFIVIISVSSIFVGAREVLLTAAASTLCYTLAILSIQLNWLPMHDGDDTAVVVTLSRALGTVGFNCIGFLVVGLLAARLAQRQSRSDVQLSEAAHALARLRALHERIVESIRSGLITTDLDGRIYTFNKAAEEMTGYTAGGLRGEDVSTLLGHMRDKTDASLQALAKSQPSPRYEADCVTADGRRVLLGYSIAPLNTEGGERSGLVITFQDLTEVRALEETSRRQAKLAAVGRLAAGIAHEIRNPLTAMRGSIQVLRSGVAADSVEAELMEIVLRESDRLNQIITDFLNYARPRPVTLSRADVSDPLRETFALLRHSPDVRDGHRVEEVIPDEPMLAMIDVAGMKQVFWNLARNALNAMPDGGTLRAELENLASGQLRITFIDTGRGMSSEQVERLFEPFSSSTTGGTGLGLSIVYQIIRDHDGTINVRSREGHGTTITIDLPSATTV